MTMSIPKIFAGVLPKLIELYELPETTIKLTLEFEANRIAMAYCTFEQVDGDKVFEALKSFELAEIKPNNLISVGDKVRLLSLENFGENYGPYELPEVDFPRESSQDMLVIKRSEKHVNCIAEKWPEPIWFRISEVELIKKNNHCVGVQLS